MHYMRKGGWAGKYRAHLISMALIGVWHGANWTFLVFGLYWGVVIATYLFISEKIAAAPDASLAVRLRNNVLLARFGPALSVATMFVIACIGWILFRAKSLTDFWTVFSGLFDAAGQAGVNRVDVLDVHLLWAAVFAMWTAELLYRHAPRLTNLAVGGEVRRLFWRCALVCVIVFSYTVAQHGRAQPFIYFQF